MDKVIPGEGFSGETLFGRTKEPEVTTCPVDQRLTGQNIGINSFIRGNWLWVDEMIYDLDYEHIQREGEMLRGDISGWRTVLARIYFGEGYTVAFFAGGGFCVCDECDCAGCGPFS